MTRPWTRLRRLIGRVGPDAFEAAKEHAWRTAAGPGRRALPGTHEDEAASSVLHDVAEAAAESVLAAVRRGRKGTDVVEGVVGELMEESWRQLAKRGLIGRLPSPGEVDDDA